MKIAGSLLPGRKRRDPRAVERPVARASAGERPYADIPASQVAAYRFAAATETAPLPSYSPAEGTAPETRPTPVVSAMSDLAGSGAGQERQAIIAAHAACETAENGTGARCTCSFDCANYWLRAKGYEQADCAEAPSVAVDMPGVIQLRRLRDGLRGIDWAALDAARAQESLTYAHTTGAPFHNALLAAWRSPVRTDRRHGEAVRRRAEALAYPAYDLAEAAGHGAYAAVMRHANRITGTRGTGRWLPALPSGGAS